MKNRIKFGLVGCGFVAKNHALILSSLKDTKLEAICDLYENRLKEYSSKFGIEKSYTDFDEMLNDSIDALVIATPNWLHSKMAVKAAKSGKHILLEKPLALSLAEANKIIKACEDNEVKISVISQYRFCPPALKLKHIIESGMIGKLIGGIGEVILRRDDNYFEESPWRAKKSQVGGGVLLHQSIHIIDLFQWYFGAFNSVNAFSNNSSQDKEVEDSASGMIKFKNNVLCNILCTTKSPINLPPRITVFGSRGIVSIEDFKHGGIYETKGIESNSLRANYPKFNSVNKIPVYARNHASQIVNFISAIRGKEKVLVDAEEAKKPLEIVLKMYKSCGLINGEKL